jgi:hypothetical protein
MDTALVATHAQSDTWCNFFLQNASVHTYVHAICAYVSVYVTTSAFISQVNTQAMHFKSISQNSTVMFPKKPYTPAGFEPGSSVPMVDAMSTAARRQGVPGQIFTHC